MVDCVRDPTHMTTLVTAYSVHLCAILQAKLTVKYEKVINSSHGPRRGTLPQTTAILSTDNFWTRS